MCPTNPIPFHGYKAITISTIVDDTRYSAGYFGGYKAITISTIVDLIRYSAGYFGAIKP